MVLSERFVAWVLHNSPKLDPGLFRTPPEATQNPTSLENAGSGIWQTGFGSFVEEQSVAIDLGHTRARSRRTRPSHQPARGSVRLPKWLGFDGAAFAMKARAWLCPVCGQILHRTQVETVHDVYRRGEAGAIIGTVQNKRGSSMRAVIRRAGCPSRTPLSWKQ